ncbi:MAG: hypothetical protein CMJ40_03105 [Phycisphaerae bacterium]|nr:hypothetical protein [Phycisphaerae bacterium]|tara:strand:- start:216 stop:683 length:468 start_codon:yes stop_codon:yes gene_type:complete
MTMSATRIGSTGFACLLISLFWAAGCASKAEVARKGKIREAERPAYVDQTSNGEIVTLLPDQILVIQLVCNIQERRRWSLVGGVDELVLKPDGQRTIQPVDSQDRPVGPPVEEIRFVAVGSGEVIVDLSYGPVGGGFAESLNRFFLKVVVDPFRN